MDTIFEQFPFDCDKSGKHGEYEKKGGEKKENREKER